MFTLLLIMVFSTDTRNFIFLVVVDIDRIMHLLCLSHRIQTVWIINFINLLYWNASYIFANNFITSNVFRFGIWMNFTKDIIFVLILTVNAINYTFNLFKAYNFLNFYFLLIKELFSIWNLINLILRLFVTLSMVTKFVLLIIVNFDLLYNRYCLRSNFFITTWIFFFGILLSLSNICIFCKWILINRWLWRLLV